MTDVVIPKEDVLASERGSVKVVSLISIFVKAATCILAKTILSSVIIFPETLGVVEYLSFELGSMYKMAADEEMLISEGTWMTMLAVGVIGFDIAKVISQNPCAPICDVEHSICQLKITLGVLTEKIREL